MIDYFEVNSGRKTSEDIQKLNRRSSRKDLKRYMDAKEKVKKKKLKK